MRSMPLSPAYQPFLSEYGLSCETVRAARVHLYRTGETILRQGCAMDSLYLLVSGTARVSVSSSDGKNLIFYSEVSSGMLGDVERIDHGRRRLAALLRRPSLLGQ